MKNCGDAMQNIMFLRKSMDLKNAFYTCYKVYGKVSTKKLIACFQDPQAIQASKKVVDALDNRYNIPPRPSELYPYDEDEGMAWLAEMPVGPGVSPCVNNTCQICLLSEGTISTLDFFQVLCGTAAEPSHMIRTMRVDVSELLATLD